MGEENTPQLADVSGVPLGYDEYMTRMYVAVPKAEEHSALRLLLRDMKREVVGETTDLSITLTQALASCPDILLQVFFGINRMVKNHEL
jgi:hypothetical protein